MSLRSRFESKCGQPDANGCIPWIANALPRGYGLMRVKRDGKWVQGYSHRIAWELKHGEIPEGQYVLHRCDNPACVNVEHLFLGTQKDNLTDMIAKGRNAPWPRWHRLTLVDKERIEDLSRSGCTQKQISEWLGISTGVVSETLSGKKHYHASL